VECSRVRVHRIPTEYTPLSHIVEHSMVRLDKSQEFGYANTICTQKDLNAFEGAPVVWNDKKKRLKISRFFPHPIQLS